MRAALYCRVSTDLQEKEQTIQSQVETLRKYAYDKGYEVVAEFLDDGYSGATLERPGLDRLRDALRSGEFEAVLVHSPDRLARKAVYQGLLLEELEKADVRIEFLNHPVDDSPEGKMLLGMQGLFAEYERAKIAERARRGKLHWARQGAVFTGFVPYGYRYLPRDGEPNRKSGMEIDEAQAATVQQMYRWLIEERLSCRAIAKRLTELGIPTCTGKTRWRPSTVNQILKDEVYKGTFYYNRGQSVEPTRPSRQNPYRKHKLTGRKLRPRNEWIPIPVPAIVDEITWEAAQRQLRENSLYSPRHNTHHSYLLRGLIRCPRCGGAYVGGFARGRRYYRCSRTEPLAAKDGCVVVRGVSKLNPWRRRSGAPFARLCKNASC
ncbi:MAG: recombinase family protein [Chloroflexi bacterium]|nr:recombinase family protein [Chloroflexota bacterium]